MFSTFLLSTIDTELTGKNMHISRIGIINYWHTHINTKPTHSNSLAYHIHCAHTTHHIIPHTPNTTVNYSHSVYQTHNTLHTYHIILMNTQATHISTRTIHSCHNHTTPYTTHTSHKQPFTHHTYIHCKLKPISILFCTTHTDTAHHTCSHKKHTQTQSYRESEEA